jgi:sensor histidine kinase YesM
MMKEDGPVQAAANTTITLLFYAAVIYGNARWLIPSLYRRKRVAAYVLASVLFLVVIVMARMWLSWFVYNHFFAPKPQPFSFKYLTNYLFSGLFVYLFSIVYRLALDYFTLRQKQEELSAAHAQAELNLLKSQVQPHFMFNTLNNIYYVAQNESPVTAGMIEKLSSIMRYFVDEGPNERLTLSTELNFIHNYVELEKLRMRYGLQEEWKIEVDPEEIMIPPMLLIPLVENVFKHGIDKRRTDNFITMAIKKQDQFLLIEVKNRLVSKASVQENKTGTGIRNLRSRLQLLYGAEYSLTSTVVNDIFVAQLKIPL